VFVCWIVLITLGTQCLICVIRVRRGSDPKLRYAGGDVLTEARSADD
jgi:hypothetical protein